MGYPDHALKESLQAVSRAQELSHATSLGLAWWSLATVQGYRGELEASRSSAGELIFMADEMNLPLWRATGLQYEGKALVTLGKFQEGIGKVKEGVAAWLATGAGPPLGYVISMAYAAKTAGQPGEALGLLDESLAYLERTGEVEREIELIWLKGELLALQSPQDSVAMEKTLRKAMELAKQRDARSFELRVATSLAGFLRDKGNVDDARHLLTSAYAWFSEGFDTGDLAAARSLLEQLG